MADEAAAAIDRRTLFRERRVGPVLGIRDRLGMIGRGGRQRPCLSVKHEGQDAAGLGAIFPIQARDLFAEPRATGYAAPHPRYIPGPAPLLGHRRPEHARTTAKGPHAPYRPPT